MAQQRAEGGCRCLLLTVDPNHERPRVEISDEKAGVRVVVTVKWRYCVKCARGRRGRCKGIIQLNVRSNDWTVAGRERGLRLEKLQDDSEDAYGSCTGEREWAINETWTYYTAVLATAELEIQRRPVTGKLTIEWQPEGCTDNLPRKMHLVVDSTKAGTGNIDVDNSDYDGDGRLNKDDRQHLWDPKK